MNLFTFPKKPKMSPPFVERRIHRVTLKELREALQTLEQQCGATDSTEVWLEDRPVRTIAFDQGRVVLE